MSNDPERIEREVERAREELARVVDQLAVRLDPKKVTGEAKNWLVVKLNEPAVKYALLGFGGLFAFLALRKLVGGKKD
ncbi:conserved hypothetical protein [Segniliparus rotundus DSM 44985]|uniref:DUF3618 domain-containing protein n=1 Tax=Segniliparus rotundus (strain ATCC BAA-972 / CDC 1076 / CIP 108378 / DSM 44985 / JCM 13578) TaxID=640132 RepID=D6ZDH9_SEGRD|nr:DUF3618 domain-containing protein [Segniliparus rotundus]ADG97243.1 conserved hypothetical protein [Segniliparus rotundus DSM 44985]